jgi:flagellar biosynthesis protein
MADKNTPPAPRTVAAAVTGTALGPKVVASGYGTVAEDILALAFAHGIKVREDADLASILAALDLDEAVPLEALTAIADILARVYQANTTATGIPTHE